MGGIRQYLTERGIRRLEEIRGKVVLPGRQDSR
jgi:hypothetical protein